MTANIDVFQRLLHGMRESFLDELSERCDRIENLILTVEKSANDREAFNELFRYVHSLKGSGGTHGLGVITAVCHQLESFLTEAAGSRGLGETFANRALAYVDLLRRVEPPARSENPDYTAIEKDLEELRQSALQSRKAGLIAESSATMVHIYKIALAKLPVRLTVVDSGLAALECLARETFDFAVIGGELKGLQGVGVIAAIQASRGMNHDMPFVLVTSNSEACPLTLKLAATLPRNPKLSDSLATTIEKLL